MDRNAMQEIANRYLSGRHKLPPQRPAGRPVSFGFDLASAEQRRRRVQARWDQRRMLRITGQATGPTKRLGRL